jgi:hypothetical protein
MSVNTKLGVKGSDLMIDIAGDWAGKILGTYNADIFVEITQRQRDLRHCSQSALMPSWLVLFQPQLDG